MLQTTVEEFKAGSTGTASPRFGHDFSRIPIPPPAAGAIQTKPAINKPGDEYEQEADRVSDQVMRMSEPQLQRPFACGGTCPSCQTKQPVQNYERLQTKRAGSGDLGQTAAPPIVHEVLRSTGQPLDPATRAFMEPRFGHDFSRVRVHSGTAAQQSARAVNARAYTVGSQIVLGNSEADTRLLAHELTHVVQQTGAVRPALQQLPVCSFICDTFGCHKPNEPKTVCPPGWRAAASKDFACQCCFGKMNESAQACCPPARIADNRCCGDGEIVMDQHCKKSSELPPIPPGQLCLPVELRGKKAPPKTVRPEDRVVRVTFARNK